MSVNEIITDENAPNSPFISTPKRRKLNGLGLIEKVKAMSPVTQKTQNSPSAPETPRSTKKRLASELQQQTTQLTDSEKELHFLTARKEELLRQITEAKAHHQIHMSKLEAKIAKYTKKNSKIESENARLKAEIDSKQKQLDNFVDSKWKSFVYEQQSQPWYREFEEKLMK